MWWIFSCTILICVLYFALILIFYIGWKRINSFVPKGNELITTELSVIVACRNEEDNIRQLIGCLAQQSFQNFELILVNDHSEDATRNYIITAQAAFPKIKLIDAVGFGKKNALKEGILNSTHELIVTTDADCLPSYHWLESIACFYEKYPGDLIICPVKLSGKDNLFSYLQVLEFTSLIASAAGSAGAGMPVMCNGANLVFTKKSWLKSQADLHEEQQSGDDMFLLESIKKRNGIIRFLKSESAFVTTGLARTLGEFIKQRRRWTSKSSAYTDGQIIFTASVVLSINLLSLVLVSLSFFKPAVLVVLLSVFLFKYIVDMAFLHTVRKFFQLNNIWIYSLLLSLIYPFYVVFIVFSALLFKPGKWK
ncbi:MAG: glycosyltransferase [Bacteroidota bacterium]|nr:glycosyltransferase [Bacteroidota bacterium]